MRAVRAPVSASVESPIERAVGDNHTAGESKNFGPTYLAISGFFLLGMRQSLTVPLALGLSIGQFLLFVFGGLWALTRLSGQRSDTGSRWYLIAILAYLTATLLSYAASMRRGVPQVAVAVGDRYLMVSLLLVLMAFAIITTVKTADDILLVMKGLVAGGTLSATFALIQSATGADIAGQFRIPGLKTTDFVLVKDLLREGVVRPQGSAGHPLELAAVLTVLIPIGFAMVMSLHARGQRAWPWAVCCAVLAGGALVTVSRSVLFGLGAVLVFMAWRWPVRRLAAFLATLVTVVVVGWLLQLRLLTALVSSFASLSDDPSIASRSNGMDYVAEHYDDHLWHGQGVGTYSSYTPQPVLDSDYLSRLMESGVVGLTVYILLLCTVLVLALRASAFASPANAEMAGGLCGAVAAFIFVGLMLDTGGFIQSTTLAWIIIALP